ncbi:transposable element Tcb2 transposase [Trichonephila clavipes]|nr:transposable element Tcb2 transposase [Trichonephila clavipes]
MPLRRFRRQYEQLSQIDKGRIINKMEAGWSGRRVARQIGRTDCVVKSCWNQWIRGMSFTRRPDPGHPRQTSRREDRHIVRNARVQQTASSAASQSQRHTTPTAGVTVWGAITDNILSSVIWIHETRAAQRYVHYILQPHALSLIQRLLEAIFQQDNARPRTQRVSQDCLRTDTTLPLPVRSPDLSPIEHIWDHLGWRVGHLMSLNELEARLQQI